ncbi:glycogen debranching protein GlgX [Gluconobacter morbifer]|nr:glycogen debranching protein GlgX [Gluconobacter morbifer]
MSNSRQKGLREGRPSTLGATLEKGGVNFAIFSAHASAVEICLFGPDGKTETDRIPLPEYTDQVFHGWIPDIQAGQLYGLRVQGPYAPDAGHRFNANKLLLDPYARAYHGNLQWDPSLFGYILDHPDKDLSFSTGDSAPFVPKAIITDPTRQDFSRPHRPWRDSVLYEMHVKGYTKEHPDVPERLRGTYAGLADPVLLKRIRDLGVTAVELLPVQSFVTDKYLSDKGLTNYWGYNTIGFFSPDDRYAHEPDQAIQEFRQLVRACHDAGLEVIMDVVYNHTAEGNELGPTLSFKGIDNASYYRLMPDEPRYYINETGTGNTFNLTRLNCIRFVADSLRYWVNEMGVDGFRFDLGTILAREADGFHNDATFLRVCRQDPVLSQVKLIAEPWDVGPGGYQVGNFPPGWAEWNDKFRDTVRDFWRGDAHADVLAPRLLASPDCFNHSGRRTWAPINFVTAHDGFTLMDCVSYNDRHNEANGEDNKDGSSDNRSCNYGAEGPTDDPKIQAIRWRQCRNMLATLFLSQGTPMLLAGDEIGRTQQGNNNAYCQDNPISWIDWAVPPEGEDLRAFVQRLTHLRSRYPILHRSRFLMEAYNRDLDIQELTWVNANGGTMLPDEWKTAQCFGLMIDGRSQPSGIRRRGADATVLLVFNAWEDVVKFTLPETGEGQWKMLLDTNQPEAGADIEKQVFSQKHVYLVTGRSVLALELVGRDPAPRSS